MGIRYKMVQADGGGDFCSLGFEKRCHRLLFCKTRSGMKISKSNLGYLGRIRGAYHHTNMVGTLGCIKARITTLFLGSSFFKQLKNLTMVPLRRCAQSSRASVSLCVHVRPSCQQLFYDIRVALSRRHEQSGQAIFGRCVHVRPICQQLFCDIRMALH